MIAAELLDRHQSLTNDLAAELRSLGDWRARAIRVHAQTWENTTHLAVTERREVCRAAVAEDEAEVAKVQGEVDALRAELNHVEFLVRYCDGTA